MPRNCFIIFALLTYPYFLYAQKKIVGRYYDHFASKIELNSDSTFKYTWQFDLQASWTKGKWTVFRDIIHFQPILIYDTLHYKGFNGEPRSTLVLSMDGFAKNIIESGPILQARLPIIQNIQPNPDKLFFKKNRLYKIRNGKLITKKYKQFWTRTKVHPWYERAVDN